MTPVSLEPGALRSRVKHSTTEPLRSLQFVRVMNIIIVEIIVHVMNIYYIGTNYSCDEQYYSGINCLCDELYYSGINCSMW